MHGFAGPTEVSRFCPESTALKALIGCENVLSIPFSPVTKHDSWDARRGWGQLEGFSEVNGEQYPTTILIQFPRFYERSLARLRRNEPRAILNITIADTPEPFCA